MPVSAITVSANLSDNWLKRRQDAQALFNAVSSGKTAAAQQALVTYRAATQKANGAQSGNGGWNARLEAEFSALVAAVQNGDMAAAQNDFALLRSDAQGAGGSSNTGSTFQSAQSAALSTTTAAQSGSQKAVNATAETGHGHAASTASSATVAYNGSHASALVFAIAQYTSNQT